MDWSIIAAIIASIVSVAALIRGFISDKPDIAGKYQDMAMKAAKRVEELQKCVDELEVKVDELETALKERDRTLAEWSAGIALLVNQLVANNHTPVWKPRVKEEARGNG